MEHLQEVAFECLWKKEGMQRERQRVLEKLIITE